MVASVVAAPVPASPSSSTAPAAAAAAVALGSPLNPFNPSSPLLLQHADSTSSLSAPPPPTDSETSLIANAVSILAPPPTAARARSGAGAGTSPDAPTLLTPRLEPMTLKAAAEAVGAAANTRARTMQLYKLYNAQAHDHLYFHTFES
ncbi:hypothetical protein DFJ73DRAFT_964128 [Zopfochytrium polystomum]|nr:hypothetical protein DFJ73DRAFT_964128 [Zopfochytrium polystomum]